MKRWIRVLCGLCLMAVLTVPALAADGYTYTVRIFAGAQGSIRGQDVVVYPDLKYGSQFTFNLGTVGITDDSKYYVKGIRESGSDTSEELSMLSFEVTKDCDYVVAYGIKGETVAYTVNYLDADGNALMPSETFYGNQGDRPVVAFQYIDGYQPQAYNLTGTLSGNEAENVFNFVYTPVPAAAQPSAAPGNTAAGTGTGTGTGTAEAETEDDAENPVENQGEDVDNIEANEPPAEVIAPNQVPQANRPADEEDIGDSDVPLGLVDSVKKVAVSAQEFAKQLNDLPAAGKAGIVSGTALLLGVIWWLLFHRRKRETYE